MLQVTILAAATMLAAGLEQMKEVTMIVRDATGLVGHSSHVISRYDHIAHVGTITFDEMPKSSGRVSVGTQDTNAPTYNLAYRIAGSHDTGVIVRLFNRAYNQIGTASCKINADTMPAEGIKKALEVNTG